MTAVATETAVPGGRRLAADSSSRLFEPSGSTLEDRILSAWEDLELEGRAGCPVCRGRLERDGCVACGSQLT